MYFAFNDVFPFQNYQYFIHKNELDHIDEILKFCVDHNFQSMAVNVNYMTKTRIKKIKAANLYLLCYTIDDPDLARQMLELGADSICTNFILPGDI